eukprot:441905-Hanusia_phi.AAC.5
MPLGARGRPPLRVTRWRGARPPPAVRGTAVMLAAVESGPVPGRTIRPRVRSCGPKHGASQRYYLGFRLFDALRAALIIGCGSSPAIRSWPGGTDAQ